jgi:hypothetical protein
LVAGVLYEARQTERMREPEVLELVFEAQGNALVPAGLRDRGPSAR